MSAGFSASAAGGDARSRELINTVSNISNQLMNEVGKVIIGKQENLRRVTVGILSNGNMLLEDFPGLGKTMLSNTFAKALGCKFKRVQFTPDLLPSDIMGTYMYDQKSGEFKLRAGPLFTNILLADEINRAPPKTQAALLEAMEEKQVTIEGITHKLPAPFVVLATQNPIEQEGTYPLPEAQMDRFLMKMSMGYPERAEEKAILAAELSCLNILANLKKSIAGQCDRFDNFVKLGGFVNSTSEYKNHPKIINGASDLLVKIFGYQGKHTRFAVGSNSLPMDIAVEIEAIIKIK